MNAECGKAPAELTAPAHKGGEKGWEGMQVQKSPGPSHVQAARGRARRLHYSCKLYALCPVHPVLLAWPGAVAAKMCSIGSPCC